MTAAKTPILQFGTSRFLQAHADLFIDEALAEGSAPGPVTVVQTTGDASRAGRVKALANPNGYPVRIRGLENGQPVDRTQTVRSIRRGLSTATDWDVVVGLMCGEITHVISNTGERGFEPQPADLGSRFDQAMSYPAKLQLLLRARYQAGEKPLQIFPTELVERNGDVLRARILELAATGDGAYTTWLKTRVIWANSLVDRIVSEPVEPAGAVAEPYGLWAIEKAPGLIPPCTHPMVRLFDDLNKPLSLKLFILNLGHTCLVDAWKKESRGVETTRALMDIDEVRENLIDLLKTEVLPGFAAAGMGDDAAAYLETTIERIRNPYLDHYLRDIAVNHDKKIEFRIRAFIAWAAAAGDTTPKPRLEAILAGR